MADTIGNIRHGVAGCRDVDPPSSDPAGRTLSLIEHNINNSRRAAAASADLSDGDDAMTESSFLLTACLDGRCDCNEFLMSVEMSPGLGLGLGLGRRSHWRNPIWGKSQIGVKVLPCNFNSAT